MTDKTLRILIADAQHFHRMKIERMFNDLDYFRIGPVQNLAELLTLTDYGCQPFDALVVNAQLASSLPDLCGFLFDHARVRRALVYGDAGTSISVSRRFKEKIIISPAVLPSTSAITQLMASVETSLECALNVCPATYLNKVRV